MAEEYTCSVCHNTYEKAWSDEDAATEAETLFPGAVAAGKEMSVVCDNCFNDLMKWRADSNA